MFRNYGDTSGRNCRNTSGRNSRDTLAKSKNKIYTHSDFGS